MAWPRLTRAASDNELRSVGADLTGLAHLTELDLRDNRLTSVPEDIGKLQLLKGRRGRGRRTAR